MIDLKVITSNYLYCLGKQNYYEIRLFIFLHVYVISLYIVDLNQVNQIYNL